MPALLVQSVTCKYLGLLVRNLAVQLNYNIFSTIILIDISINQQETYEYDINHICLLYMRLLCGLGCSRGDLMAICKQAALQSLSRTNPQIFRFSETDQGSKPIHPIQIQEADFKFALEKLSCKSNLCQAKLC